MKNSILEISVTNIGLGPVRISSIIHCDNENFSDRNLKPRTLTLESEMGNIEIIPPSSNGKIRYMFADYIEPRFSSNAPMGVHQNIVKALLENQYEILECKIVAEDDTGPLYDRSAHVIEIEKDKETGKLRGAFL